MSGFCLCNGPKASSGTTYVAENLSPRTKYNSAGGDFVFNAAVFYADYSDIQLETLAPDGIAPQLDNAGTGESP